MLTTQIHISFIRHGLVHNPENIIYGRMPGYRLSIQGIEDARRAAEALKDVPLKAVYSSPLLRTRQTAKELLRHHPTLKLAISSLLTEVNTAFEGQPESHLKEVFGDVYAKAGKKHEQPHDILERSMKFIQKIRKTHAGGHVAAVTHGDVILFLQLWANGYKATAGNKLNLATITSLREYPATGSVTTLTYTSEKKEEIPLCSYRNTAHSVPS